MFPHTTLTETYSLQHSGQEPGQGLGRGDLLSIYLCVCPFIYFLPIILSMPCCSRFSWELRLWNPQRRNLFFPLFLAFLFAFYILRQQVDKTQCLKERVQRRKWNSYASSQEQRYSLLLNCNCLAVLERYLNHKLDQASPQRQSVTILKRVKYNCWSLSLPS